MVARRFFYWAAIFLLPFALMALYLLYTAYARIEITPELVRLVMPLWPTYAMRCGMTSRM